MEIKGPGICAWTQGAVPLEVSGSQCLGDSDPVFVFLPGVARFMELQAREYVNCAQKEGLSLDRVHHLPLGC